MADNSSGAGALLGQMSNMLINALGRGAGEAYDREGERAIQNAYYEQLGILAPQLNQLRLEQQQRTGLKDISEDTRLRDYQLQALQSLGNIVGAGGGLTAEDAATLAKTRQETGIMNAGLRGAAAQNAEARGIGGSQAALLSNLNAAQAATNQANVANTQAAGDARARYLKALDALSGQASNLRAQDYAKAANEATAQDAINRFNANMRWGNAQYNQGLSQQNFENQMNLVNQRLGAAGGYNNAMRARGGDKKQDAGYWGEQVGNFVNSAVSSAGGGMGGSGGGGGVDYSQLMSMFGGGK